MMSTEPQNPQERRRHTRVQGEGLPLLLQEGSEPLRVRDLSESGLAFFSDQPVPMMTKVGFRLELPHDSQSLEAAGEGVVVRCERLSSALGHYEVAVFFQDPTDEMLGLVRAFVELQLSKGLEA